MTRLLTLFACLAVATAPTAILAQGPSLGVAPHVGTLGLGVDFGVAVHDRVTLRVGAGVFPSDVDLTISDIKFTVDLPSPQFVGFVDLFLTGQFRVSGGVLFSSPDLEVTGVFTGTVDIGNTTYAGTDVGSLTGTVANNDIAPYLGIGWGNIAGGRIGFIVDLGVAFQGQPDVTFTADGPISQTPGFRADLDREVAAAEDDLNLFKYYPVISIGLSFSL